MRGRKYISKEEQRRIDEEDIAIALERAEEPVISYDEMMKWLKADGVLPKDWSPSQ